MCGAGQTWLADHSGTPGLVEFCQKETLPVKCVLSHPVSDGVVLGPRRHNIPVQIYVEVVHCLNSLLNNVRNAPFFATRFVFAATLFEVNAGTASPFSAAESPAYRFLYAAGVSLSGPSFQIPSFARLSISLVSIHAQERPCHALGLLLQNEKLFLAE